MKEFSDLNLNGFRYGNLDGDEKAVEKRLDLLASAKPFSEQPYEELARVYRGHGRNSDARKVRLREQQEKRRQANLPRLSWAWNLFLEGTVGYGYRPQRVLIVLALVWGIGAPLFHHAQHMGVMEAVGAKDPTKISATDCKGDYPCFFPAVYSLELLIPVVNLRQVQYWLPDISKGWGVWYFLYAWGAILLGYMAVTALAAGLGRVWRTE